MEFVPHSPSHGVLLMTALPPTVGHEFLIQWSLNFLAAAGHGPLHVIVSTRSHEPLAGDLRVQGIAQQFATAVHSQRLLVHHHADDSAPQNPSESNSPAEFWAYWRAVIEDQTQHAQIGMVFASEPYGQQVANTIAAEFIPVDIRRDILAVRATEVRQSPDQLFAHLMPSMRPHFARTVTFYGAESCGKTTQSRAVAQLLPSQWVHEWARPYLETVGSDLTQHKMRNISMGQYALQCAVKLRLSHPFVLQDTDLLSTIGYYRILGLREPPELVQMFQRTRSDLYVVMHSGIPFEPDALRYGGDVRQGSDEFWLALLEEYHCNSYRVQAVDPQKQVEEIHSVILNDFHSHANMKSFVRT